jgi:isocitrate lyase
VNQVKNWWSSERFSRTFRPYSAEDVVSKRGQLHIEYPANQQSKKLWKLLMQHKQRGTASHTFGALDPIQVRIIV